MQKLQKKSIANWLEQVADDVSNNLNACFTMSSESRSTSPTAALGQRSSARTCSSDSIHAGESSDTISMLRSPQCRGPKHVSLSKSKQYTQYIRLHMLFTQYMTCCFYLVPLVFWICTSVYPVYPSWGLTGGETRGGWCFHTVFRQELFFNTDPAKLIPTSAIYLVNTCKTHSKPDM